ncbi:MAG: hypothetical protein JXB03_04845 [Spirochaetales bacterium]|nr:hypothetical protein [Spirochaetales bacterium]
MTCPSAVRFPGARRLRLVLFFTLVSVFISCASHTPSDQGVPAGDEKMLVFLLIGQSNMEGIAKPQIQDLKKDPRIQVLAYQTNAGEGRLYNRWYTASPPLHSSWAGVGIGDYFAKTLIDKLPDGYSIGLVPCGISGVDIDFFRKGAVSARRSEFFIPPDNTRDGAYDWVLERARLAQKKGTIAGVLLHQGESDAGQLVWLDKVARIMTDLRRDLGIPDLPLVAGELLYGGPCAGHNRVIAGLPARVRRSALASARGLEGLDQFHFNLEGVRELGRRYAEAMLEFLEW